MKVIIITGSPRAGESEKVAVICKKELIRKHHEVEVLKLSKDHFNPCIACGYCNDVLGCSQKDGMDSWYQKLDAADALVFISPVYMGGMTAQLKAFVDRTVALRRNGFRLRGKPGCAIAIGGSRNGGQEFTISQVHHAMQIHGMVIIGDSNHFGGAVHAPLENDEIGKQTVIDTMKELMRFDS